MAYRFYVSFDIAGKPSIRFPDDKARLTPIIYTELDDALGAARNGLARGLNVHAIESDDGNILMRADIQRLVSQRGPQLVGRPRVY